MVPRVAHFARIASFGSCIHISSCRHGSDCKNETNAPVRERGLAFARRLPPLAPGCRRIYLLRHGQTDWNARGLLQGGGFDIKLNETGRAQGLQVAEELAAVPIGIIASSPLSRAHGTADRVKAYHPGARRVVVSTLSEMRFGGFEGAAIRGPDSTQDLAAHYERVSARMRADTNLRWPGPSGESLAEVEVRARSAVAGIMKLYPEERHICCVAHSRLNKIFIASQIWGDVSRQADVEQGNTCINVVDFDEEGGTWKQVLLNYVEHADLNS